MTMSTSPAATRRGHRARLRRGEEPRQDLDAHRRLGEAVAEGLEVLLREQRRRDEDRDLATVLHGLERGAQRDLGLAEADVAAHQAVHRGRRLHVGLDRVDRLELVRGLLERERRLDLVLPGRVRRERVPLGRESPLVEHDQLLGDLGDRRAHLGLRPGEVRPAHLVELRCLATRVQPDGVDLVRGHVELVATAVLEQQVVALDSSHRASRHPREPADPVDLVHHVVARAEILEERLRVASRRASDTVGTATTGQVRLGEQGEPRSGQDRAALDRCDDDPPAGPAQLGLARRVEDREGAPVLRQQLLEPRRRHGPVRADHHGEAVVDELTELTDEPLAVTADGRPPERGDRRGVRGVRERREGPHRCSGVHQQPVEVDVEPRQGGRRPGGSALPLAPASGSSPQVRASDVARSASSASRSAARSRSRRGSTSRIWASSPTRSNSTCSRSATHAVHASMPSKTSPSASRCQCSRPTAHSRSSARRAPAPRAWGAARGRRTGRPGRPRRSCAGPRPRTRTAARPRRPTDRCAPGRRRSRGRRRRSSRARTPRHGARPGTRAGSRPSPVVRAGRPRRRCRPVRRRRARRARRRGRGAARAPVRWRPRPRACGRRSADATACAAVGPSTRSPGSPARTGASPTPGTARPRPPRGTSRGRPPGVPPPPRSAQPRPRGTDATPRRSRRRPQVGQPRGRRAPTTTDRAHHAGPGRHAASGRGRAAAGSLRERYCAALLHGRRRRRHRSRRAAGGSGRWSRPARTRCPGSPPR